MGFTFSYTSLGAGSITAEIADDAAFVRLTASFLSDGLGDLTRVVVALLRGAPQAYCSWQEEPGEYRWLFLRTGDELRLHILEFPETLSKRPDEEGRCIFATTCMLASFAGQIKSQLERIFDEHGIEGYRALWKTYAFPVAEYEELRSLLRRRPAAPDRLRRQG